MSTVTVFLIVLAVLGLAWFEHAGRQPVAHRPISAVLLATLLEALLYRGTGQTQLRIEVIGEERSFLLAKYIRNDPDSGRVVGITGTLSRNGASETVLSTFRTELQARGVAYSGDEAGQGVVVDCGTDLRAAAELVRLVFERVFQVHLATQTVGYFRDLLPGEFPRLTGIKRAPG